jgi:hypothetical protein
MTVSQAAVYLRRLQRRLVVTLTEIMLVKILTPRRGSDLPEGGSTRQKA